MKETILDKLESVANGNREDLKYLLSLGTLVNYSETENGINKDLLIFRNKEKEEFIYTKFSLINNIQYNKDLGLVTLESGSSFFAKDYNQALKCLDMLKESYIKFRDLNSQKERYEEAQVCQNAIEEIDGKINYYEQKQRQSSKDS